MEQQINVIEEATDDYQIVPDPQEDRSMVATSSTCILISKIIEVPIVCV